MEIAGNILKHYLKNVYFITGAARRCMRVGFNC